MKPSVPEQSDAIAASPHERSFYGEGARVVAPASYGELLDVVRDAEARKTPLIPAGVGAHAYLGNPPPEGAIIVSLRKLDRVLRYEPGDFTVGVQAGLPLTALRETLARNDQEVPVDFALNARGTVGGLIAAAQPGVRRGRHGPVRAFVIGIHALRCGPNGPVIYKAGGMVVKNVAGYEVMKLLTGSLGTAGLILEVNFKLRPLPDRRAARVAPFPSREKAWTFAKELRARNLDPAALWVLEGGAVRQLAERCPAAAGGEHSVAWAFEGNASRVAWQEAQAESILAAHRPEPSTVMTGGDLDALLDFLCDFPSPGGEPIDGVGIARLSALPSEGYTLAASAAAAVSRGDGGEPGLASDALSGLATIRWPLEATEGAAGRAITALVAAARAHNGAGTLLYLPPALRRGHQHLLVPDPNAGVARKLLHALDPSGVFSPGRVLGIV